MKGYCVRCRSKQEMVAATRTLMKNGRRAMIGHCGRCGTKMSVAGIWDGDSPASPAMSRTAKQPGVAGQPASEAV